MLAWSLFFLNCFFLPPLLSQQRASTTIVSVALNLAYMIANQQLTYSNSKGRRYAGIVLTQSVDFTPHPLNVAYVLRIDGFFPGAAH